MAESPPQSEDSHPLRREKGEEWKHPHQPIKAQEITVKRGDEEIKKIAVFSKEESHFVSLETGEPVSEKRWRKVTEIPRSKSTDVLFALAEAHGYELEAK